MSEEKHTSDTIFRNVMDLKAEDGLISIEDYEEAKALADQEGERRSNTLWGGLKSEWRANKKDVIKSLFKGFRGLVTTVLTSASVAAAAWFLGFFDKL